MGKGSKKQTSTTVNDVPDWLRGYYQELASEAKAQYGKEYPIYDIESRIAPLSSQTMQAQDFLEGTALNQTGAYDKAMTVFDRLAGQSGLDQYQNYVNPYLEDVLGAARSNLQDEAARNSAQLAAQKGSAGAFGGSRFAVAEELQRQGNLDKLNELETSQRAQAYESGWDKYLRDTANQAGSAQNLMAGAGQAQQGYLQAGSQLAAVGEANDQRAQMLADLKYEDWLNAQNWDSNKLQQYAAMIGAAGEPFSTTTQTQRTSGGSKLGSILGTALSVGSMFIPGGQFASALGMGASNGLGMLSGGTMGGMFGGGFTNTAMGPISWR